MSMDDGDRGCARVVELLPWWVNQSLSADEAQQVRRHIETCTTCREELQAVYRAVDIHEGHLPAEVLITHAFSEPAAVEQRRLVESHLAACPQCRDELDMLCGSRDRMLAGDSPSPAPLPQDDRGTRRVVRMWRLTALAASLLAAVLGAGMIHIMTGRQQQQGWSERERALRHSIDVLEEQLARERSQPAGDERDLAEAEIARLDEQLERSRAPRLNTTIVHLLPTGVAAMRGEDSTATEIELEPDAQRLHLVLFASGPPSTRPRRVELLDAGGATVWSASGLVASSDGEYTIDLPVSLLPAEHFTLRVRSSEDMVKDAYEVRIIRPPG